MKMEEIKNDENIALTIALKYNQLKRNELEHLEISQLINYLFKCKWKTSEPINVADAIVEIMNVDAAKIVAYLSNDAVVKSKHNNLSDFSDLFAKELG